MAVDPRACGEHFDFTGNKSINGGSADGIRNAKGMHVDLQKGCITDIHQGYIDAQSRRLGRA
jgi:hypothetical protein